ncbi:energy-coupling factor ABC transporter ATP-binding protein [Ectobacillus antri]|uniref:Energy-coupling factor transporter ATP-binding protein EcfA2 n=1 Tax=Ectobacillus antri TaxID=2486280 RepID=A0ABT6H7L8_9BACI|nr:energy-coupling factor ABC transporter ATP-binding protein [Ectobacillus antri]MDG4657894.1 energy-coupling factor ABC transporter ATP-binding protein [Ectobacillus antri]MDG5754853.1 energy-coupling factor ABC transporter ATP-binding protein [Ectobacillus antri]
MDIIFKKVEHRYQKNTPFERLAIYDIDLSFLEGGYYAIIGHTGSGKSTVIQHLNALLKPTAGKVELGDIVVAADKKQKKLKGIRKKVGIVFQYPEHQLFEETVEKDICFGPLNFGVSSEEAKKKAAFALEMVGLPIEFLQKSPFELSGGQMRRVAIAGVLAMEPEVLVLDEPTAGLDPRGQEELMAMFYKLHKQRGITVILVTHNMEDAAQYAQEVVVMHKGTVFLRGKPEEVFSNATLLEEIGLSVPLSVKCKQLLEQRMNITLDTNALTIEALAEEITSLFKKGGM